jgi:hypothetical protein
MGVFDVERELYFVFSLSNFRPSFWVPPFVVFMIVFHIIFSVAFLAEVFLRSIPKLWPVA